MPDGRLHKLGLDPFRIRTGKLGVGIKGIPPNTPAVLVVRYFARIAIGRLPKHRVTTLAALDEPREQIWITIGAITLFAAVVGC